MNKKYTYEELLDIVQTLRSENGCPWDREQTHKSLRPCMMEEAAEVVSAIRIYDKTGNAENLQEELGDVLLQVVMHARIAEEEGLFSMEDVVDDIASKMVRRHPHVFGNVIADDSSQVLENWEEIKKKEKEEKTYIDTPLKEIPIELPALTRATKVLKKADKYYGRHGSIADNVSIIKKTAATLEGMSGQQDDTETERELGNILMALSDIAGIKKISLEQILADRIEDFIEDCEKDCIN